MSSPFLRRASVAIFSIISGLACTAVVAGDPTQCATDEDCTVRGGDFAGTKCDTARSVCVPGELLVKPACLKHSDCPQDSMCSETTRACVPVRTAECTEVYGDPREDGAVVLGLLSDVRDTGAGFLFFRERSHLLGAELAIKDFQDRSGARLPGNRRVVLVGCGQSTPRSTTAHLVELGAKAIIGPTYEDRLRAVAETAAPYRVPIFDGWVLGNPAGVVPGAADLVWMTSFRRNDVVPPVNAMLGEIGKMVREDLKDPNAKLKVAVFVGTRPEQAEFRDLTDQLLTFNDKTAIENKDDAACSGPAGKGCYRRFDTRAQPAASVKALVDEVIAFGPHVLVPFTDIDWGSQFVPVFEEAMKAQPATVYRPVYLHPFTVSEDFGYTNAAVFPSTPTQRRRVQGIRPARDNAFELFSQRYRETFRPASNPSKLGPLPSPGGGRAYETTLLLMMAMFDAAQRKEGGSFSPSDVVASIPRVTDAKSSTRITLNDIPAGIAQLALGRTIRVSGVWTQFDMDYETRVAKPSWTTYCLDDKSQYFDTNRKFENGAFSAGALCN
jgi:hypothetical protein